MAKRLNSVLGIDIGSKSIKVAEMRFQGRQPVVTALGQADTPAGAVDQMQIHDGDAVGAVVKSLCQMVGATTSDAVVSVAGQKAVLVRVVSDVPADINDDELKQHMLWEKDRSNPFNEDVEMGYQRLDAGSGGKANVLMALTPKTAVKGIQLLLKKAGKKPFAVDVEPLSIARDLMTGYEADARGRTLCVVEIGHLSTAINIYKDGLLMMPRQVPMGGEMFTRALADGMNVSVEQAEQTKCEAVKIPAGASAAVAVNPFDVPIATGTETQQFTPYNPFADADEDVAVNPFDTPAEPAASAPVPAAAPADPYFNVLAPVLEQLVEEIRRSVDYYRSQGGSVNRMLIAGGGAKLEGLDGYLERSLGIECEVLDPLRSVNVALKKPDPSGNDGKAEYAVAVGNCLHAAF